MKKLLKIIILSMILLTVMCGMTRKTVDDGTAYCVMDVSSGRVLYEKNATQEKRIASLTKVATCITTIEKIDLNEEVEIKKEWTGIEGSSVYLKEGEKLTVEELLYCLMLRSGNDCATALNGVANEHDVDLVGEMNALAERVGAANTVFKNPHGLDEENHFSTAGDLVKICRYAMKNKVFKKIVSTQKYSVGRGESSRVLINKNKLLARYKYADGIKTGYTKKSGRCLASGATKDDFSLVCVVLDTPSTYETTEKLFDRAFENYKNVLLQPADEPVAFYEKHGKKLPCYVDRDIRYPLTDTEKLLINKKVEFTYDKDFPVESGEEMGVISFYLEKQLLFCQKIFNIIK